MCIHQHKKTCVHRRALQNLHVFFSMEHQAIPKDVGAPPLGCCYLLDNLDTSWQLVQYFCLTHTTRNDFWLSISSWKCQGDWHAMTAILEAVTSWGQGHEFPTTDNHFLCLIPSLYFCRVSILQKSALSTHFSHNTTLCSILGPDV
jgi:hypothetical protein